MNDLNLKKHLEFLNLDNTRVIEPLTKELIDKLKFVIDNYEKHFYLISSTANVTSAFTVGRSYKIVNVDEEKFILESNNDKLYGYDIIHIQKYFQLDTTLSELSVIDILIDEIKKEKLEKLKTLASSFLSNPVKFKAGDVIKFKAGLELPGISSSEYAIVLEVYETPYMCEENESIKLDISVGIYSIDTFVTYLSDSRRFELKAE
jgi:hypothetical protein